MLDMIEATKAGHPGVDQWNTLINKYAPQYGVPPNLLKAHVLYESGGDANVVSFDQGCGLCQITSGVTKQNGMYLYQGSNILAPGYNLTVACKNFIKPNIEAFPNDLDAIIAAFNAGIGAVRNAIKHGTPMTEVTYGEWYVPSVRGAYQWFCAQAHKELKK